MSTTNRAAVGVVVLLAGVALATSGCSSTHHDPAEQPSTDQTRPSARQTSVQRDRPFERLKADEPGGPIHRDPYPAGPTAADLERTSSLGPTRLAAEAFAILVNHAIEDQTAGSVGDTALTDFGRDLPADAIATVTDIRSFPGNQTVAGSRGYVRSVGGAAPSLATRIQVVEKIESPMFADSPEQPFVYWAQALLIVAWSDGHWIVTDFQSAAASEYEKFSAPIWRDVMDSGRDWRRFDVAE